MSILSASPLSPLDKETAMIRRSPTFSELIAPLEAQLPYLSPLESGSNKPITYTFDYQMRGLVYYHVECFDSALALLEGVQMDPLVNQLLAPPAGLGQSTFYEANASRGSVQMIELFHRLFKKACKQAPIDFGELGHLVAIDGTLIEASLSMRWADYRSTCKKARMHLGFDLNRSIPRKMHLSAGKGAERAFVSVLLDQGETGVLDRGYQDHRLFDQWIEEKKHFVARLRNNTQWELLEVLPFEKGTSIFFFARVLLGDETHRMKHPVYLTGFKADGKIYYVATDRDDLSAEQIAFIFSLRWAIETFFAWWKRHLKVYHLIARSEHGLLIQLLAGLITYLLLVIYFHRRYNKAPCLRLLRKLRWDIRHETQTPRPLHISINIQLRIYPIIHVDIPFLMLLWLWINQPAIF